MVRKIVLAAAALALITGRPARGQGSTLIVGVANVKNGAPITNAEVVITDQARRARTDWMGEARFADVPAGAHEVRVRRIGFSTSDVRVAVKGDSSSVVFMLEEAATALDTVRVMAERLMIESHRLFERRKTKGLGRFLDEDALSKEGTRDFPLVAVAHFPGLMLITGRGGQWSLASREGSCGVDTSYEELTLNGKVGTPLTSQGTQTTGNGGGNTQAYGQTAAHAEGSCFSAHPCHVRMFLDNVPVAQSDINIIRTEQLYGAEYYAIGDAPPEYRLSGAACGVLLLWSKAWDGT